MSDLTLFVERLFLTLLHSLWQAGLIAVLVAAVVRLAGRPARLGYAASMTGLFAALGCMPVTFLTVAVESSQRQVRPIASAAEAPITPDQPVSLSSQVTPPAIDRRPPYRVLPSRPSATSMADHPASADVPIDRATAPRLVSAAPWIVAGYAVGVVLMLVRLCRASASVGRLVRGATMPQDDVLTRLLEELAHRWHLRITPTVRVTREVLVPQVVGLFRPVILLPASALTGLSREELELVLVHEIAHLRRFDLWATWIQRFAEVVLFFNPAVWFLSRRISEFREYCCDDLVCQTASTTRSDVPVRYAEALLRVVSLATVGRTEVSGLAALAVSGRSPSELRRRIARILSEPVSEPFPGGRGVLTILGAGLLWLVLPALLPTSGPVASNNPTALAAEPVNGKTEQREFRLRVNGPDGAPIPNVDCEIQGIPSLAPTDVLLGSHKKDRRYGSVIATTEQGELGFRRPARAEWLGLSIRVSGFGPYLTTWRLEDGSEGIPDAFTITLEAGWTVVGRVVDEAGEPIEGATVSPSVKFRRRPGDEQEVGIGTKITTDAAGFWRYTMVPASMESVWVIVDHPDYAPSRMALRKSECDQKLEVPPKSMVLSKGLSVSGTVSDETGKRIAGATVRTKYMNETRETITDQEGRYTLRGCEPKVNMMVCSAPGRAPEMQEVLFDPAMAPVDFTLLPGRHVRIRILDENGKGVAGSRVFFQFWRRQVSVMPFMEELNQDTDDQGVWEWNEAPVDEFLVDICRKDGMMLSFEPIVARDEEYVFRPARLLNLSGRVTDKATGELIPSFRCVPGYKYARREQRGEFWQTREVYTSKDGTYKLTRDTDTLAHLVRIEADGYQVAVSRDIKSDEGDVQLNFELVRVPDIAIAFKTPAGQPAAEADVAIGLKKDQIIIKNGEFTRQTYATRRLKTDGAGIVNIPGFAEPFEMFVLHPAGFAQVRCQPGEAPQPVTLTAWATVRGTIHRGERPAAETPVDFNSQGGFQSELCRVSCYSETRSDAHGAFVMSRVFPGTGRIGRQIVHMVRDGATEATSSKMVPLTCAAGETITVEIGRGGRSVVGKFTLPQGAQQVVAWRRMRVQLLPDIPQPVPTGLDVNAPETYEKWRSSKEGREYEAQLREWQAKMDALPVFEASVERDGSFRIDNVPSGKYAFPESTGPEGWKMPVAALSVVIDQSAEGAEQPPIDLGRIELIPQ